MSDPDLRAQAEQQLAEAMKVQPQQMPVAALCERVAKAALPWRTARDLGWFSFWRIGSAGGVEPMVDPCGSMAASRVLRSWLLQFTR